MISQFRVQNYKALRDVTLDLTPIHLLIGPNDSGKTSILEAIAALSRTVDGRPVAQAFTGPWSGTTRNLQSSHLRPFGPVVECASTAFNISLLARENAKKRLS